MRISDWSSDVCSSDLAAEETLPLRDAFAVLFFVSVGMLFNPTILIERPWSVLTTVLIIVVGKSIAAYAIVRLFAHPHRTALTVAASLAQIGERSEEHTSELQSLMRISYAVFCLKKKNTEPQ